MSPPGISTIACERTINCHLLQPLLELHQKISENMFLQSVFKSIEDSQKHCISLHDAVCIKKRLLYHGCSLFGKSKDDPTSLIQTILGIMTVY